MLRRCVSELSPARSLGRRRRLITPQIPLFFSSRNEFSTAPPKKTPQKPVPPELSFGSGSPLKKLVLGSVVVGAAALAAYQTGYIDLRAKAPKDEQHRSNDLDAVTTLKHTEVSDDRVAFPSVGKSSELKPNADDVVKIESHHLQDLDVNHETGSEIKPAEGDAILVKKNELSKLADKTRVTRPVPDEQISSRASFNVDNKARFDLEQNKCLESSIIENNVSDSSIQVSEESATRDDAPYQDTTMEVPKVSLDEGKEVLSLADSHLLHADEVSSAEREKTDDIATFFNEIEVSVPESGKSKDENKPGNEKIVLDFIEAIHAAETRQAEKDAYIFSEEKWKLKEKYEKELKDARARELMYAEEAAILEKELIKEKIMAAAANKSLQEKAEQKLHVELQRKEEEADVQLTKAHELAKAELAAAIASEKASQIEKVAEANMNINALCMAFNARSEEARQTHSVYKLALGTLALEDALSKGLPIRAEVNSLHKSLEGIDKDSLLDLVLSSLPEDVLNYGADTQMHLNQKFDSLKGTLRHFSLIPAGGGGLLAHTVAHVASSIKMRKDQSGDGIESVISKVESYLVQRKFVEAAEALEGGVQGSEAAQVVVEWVTQARNRAVVEQALSLLQSYASSITFS